MNKTEELLLQIRQNLREGRMAPESIPIDDIKECVRLEMEYGKNPATFGQIKELLKIFDCMCDLIADGEKDSKKIEMFLDGMILCIAAIPESLAQAVLSLANRDYWSYKHRDELDDPEVREIIDYIDKKRTVGLINYDFVDEYKELPCEVFYDPQCDMRYVPYKGRKMYFPRGYEEEYIINYFHSVLWEQDAYSPHCYRKDGYEVKDGAVIIDAGAAEGIFTLDHIDEAEKIYVIDADQGWIEALQHTFANDMDKVEIIYGFVGQTTDGRGGIALDDLAGGKTVNYIKMDIEGYEKPSLLGAGEILQANEDITCAICTYHCEEDESWVTDYFQKMGFTTDHSRGYICPNWSVKGFIEAELRRGVVFGKKTGR